MEGKMAKKPTKVEVNISNEPRRLKSRETYVYVSDITTDISGDINEITKALSISLRAVITTALTELKSEYPNESVTIKPGELYLPDFELPVLISREETDSEVLARVKAAALTRAKDLENFQKLAQKLGVSVDSLLPPPVSGS
jgi:hypothetical protein